MVAPHGFGNIGGVHSLLGSHDQIGDRHNGKQDGHGTHRSWDPGVDPFVPFFLRGS